MSTVLTWQTKSGSSANTEQLARIIGTNLRGGEVFVLDSDLGGGKTTFVRGLVAGSGSTESVSSPSFTISRVYEAPNFTFYHFDFYRLQDAGLMEYELQEAINLNNVVVIEWAKIVEFILPADTIKLEIIIGEQDKRELRFQYPESKTYIFEGLAK